MSLKVEPDTENAASTIPNPAASFSAVLWENVVRLIVALADSRISAPPSSAEFDVKVSLA